MSTMRRGVGIGVILFSVVGLLLCLGGLAGLWLAAGRVAEVEEAVFKSADEALVFMHAKVEGAAQAVARGRERTGLLAEAAGRVRDAGDAAAVEFEPLQRRLDEIFAELRAAEHWLEASQAIAASVGRVSESIASSDAAASRERLAALAERVREFSLTVGEALARLDGVRREIIEMREKRELVREIAKRIADRLADTDTRLAELGTRLGELSEQVSAARVSCADIGDRVKRWTFIGLIGLNVVLLWFAVSQVGMISHGRRLASGVAGV